MASDEMSSKNVLIAGCGDLGQRIGRQLRQEGHTVWGLRRSARSLEPLRALQGDLGDEESLDQAFESVPSDFDLVVYAVAADRFDDAAYRRAYVDGVVHLRRALARRAGKDPSGPVADRCLYVSSTSVYGTMDGSVVDETSPAEPPGFGGRRLLEGEAAARSLAPVAVALRLGGIYGPGRERLLRTVRDGSAVCYDAPTQWTNRIHVDDAARAAVHLIGHESPEPLYLGVDDAPSADGEVKRWLARRLGVAEPPPAESGPSSTSRRMRSNKRCSNARLRASGFELDYPTYREGYGALIDAGA